MNNMTVKGIMLMLVCMNVVLYISGFQLVDIGPSGSPGENMVEQFVNVDGQNISLDSSRTEDIESIANPTTGIPGFLTDLVASFVDVMIMIGKFLAFLINITVAPLALFTQIPDIPMTIVFLIGVPLCAAWYVAVAYFIKGAD